MLASTEFPAEQGKGTATSAADPAPVKQTPLHGLHLSKGGRMVPFAGYALPVHYPEGIMAEHLHCRAAAALFDVSHMGQIMLRPRSGRMEDAALALERLVPVDVLGLGQGRQRYAFFTNDAGGLIDDLMVANRGDHLLLVVNAACKEADEAHLRAHLADACEIVPLTGRALLALQGPRAEAVLARLNPAVAAMRFIQVAELNLGGAACVVSRSGYTGEDGFEISVAADSAVQIAELLLADPDVKPAGLGARDSLRLEAGLCLYGADLDSGTSPVEAGLEWAIQPARRVGGMRAGGFPGAAIILEQIACGAAGRRVGLRPEGRAPVRGQAMLFGDIGSDVPIGTVTSGAFGPSIGAPVAMGYAAAGFSRPDTVIFAELRGKRVPVTVTPLPFVPHDYKR